MAALSMPGSLRSSPPRCAGPTPSVIATGSQAANNLPGTVGCGASGGQPALQYTPNTIPHAPTGWTIGGPGSARTYFANTSSGSVSNVDFTGFTLLCDGTRSGGSLNLTFNNCLFAGQPGDFADTLFGSGHFFDGAQVFLNNCTFDGALTTKFSDGYSVDLVGKAGGLAKVTMRHCLFQNIPWSPIQASCNTDVQFCVFGPPSLKAIPINHTDTIFCHGGTHLHANNLFDFTMPAQDGQKKLVQGPEGWFNDTNVSSVTLTCNNNIWRGLASYEAAGANVDYIWRGGVGGVSVNSLDRYNSATGVTVVSISGTSGMNVGDRFQLNGLGGTGAFAAFQNHNYTISAISGVQIAFTAKTGIGSAKITSGYFNNLSMSCTINANNNAVERGGSGYYSMIAGGTFNNGGNNRDYHTNVAF